MLPIFDGLRDITLPSIALRLVLAMVCGGVVGIEREYKHRPAGFRTHILICLGAALTTMTSQFWFLNMHYYLDMARMGAGVVAGIGFMGAGTIIVTRHRRVRGLTTAAGLWVSAIAGLALGAGFYEGGICAVVLVLLAELFFSKLEYRLLESSPEVHLYLEYMDQSCLETLLARYSNASLKILDLSVIRADRSEHHNACALFTLRLHRGYDLKSLLKLTASTMGVVSVREL